MSWAAHMGANQIQERIIISKSPDPPGWRGGAGLAIIIININPRLENLRTHFGSQDYLARCKKNVENYPWKNSMFRTFRDLFLSGI